MNNLLKICLLIMIILINTLYSILSEKFNYKDYKDLFIYLII